jgi:hypothetical protein
MASRNSNINEVWVITYNYCSAGGSVSHLSTGHWFGSKEKAEAYMSKHHMPNPRYRPERLRQHEE